MDIYELPIMVYELTNQWFPDPQISNKIQTTK